MPPVPGLDPNIFLTALVAGVLGGVTGAMRSLWVHVAQKQDFDPQHGMWYFLNPLMGLVLAVLNVLDIFCRHSERGGGALRYWHLYLVFSELVVRFSAKRRASIG